MNTLEEPGLPLRAALAGIALVLAATFSFALGDVSTKYLAGRYPVEVILAVRYALNTALLLAFVYPKLGARLWATNRVWLVIGRGGCLALASLTLALALRLMPVGETIAIIYLSPFVVMLLSAPFLGEPVRRGNWIWAALGFAGVLIIVRPGGGLDAFGVTLALINAGLATAYHLLTHLLSRTETTISLLFHTAWVGTVVFGLWAAPSLSGLAIAAFDLVVMLGLGVAYSLGHYLFTAAYRAAPPSLLAPVNYAHLVWAGGLGFLFFGDVPGVFSLAGMGLICVSGVAIALSARRK
ncbi:DMT family transporter [Labrenzia sp. 5N]|uniref:DMT family transporter n=1 Tax=Labrenzia sp. 5N TaxID=2723402 RepID=UPI00144894BE|nr:DMT family transporter [Labrenzia sp. 5N]NKX64385.1 DMT family transporter [Labrenzia sp. 5N]